MTPARSDEIVAAARALLESEGRDAVSMRRIADSLRIKAPSIYKHFPDKSAVETAIIAEGLAEWGRALEGGATLAQIAACHRRFALEHRELYLLMTDGPLDRDRLPAGLEERAARPLLEAVPDRDLARAAWAAAHGLVSLEIAGRFPPDADLDAAWRALTQAIEGASPARARRRSS